MSIIIENFRDIGGLKTEDGRYTQSGFVFRSSQLSSVPIDDLTHILDEYRINRIVDFRTNDEILKHGGYSQNFRSDIEYIRFPLQCEGIVRDEIIRRERGFYGDKYLYYHLLKNETAAFKKTFDLISEAKDRPIVLHCIAGKDRTGIMIALLLLMLNVSKEEILLDYLKTRKADPENFYHLMNLIGERGGISAYIRDIGVEQSTIDRIDQFLVK